MDLALDLSHDQFNWLRKVVNCIFEDKVKFAKDWEDGRATVIVFEDNSYIWCLPSDVPYVQGEGTFHFPRFKNKDEYIMAHKRLEKNGLSPTDIGDFSEKSGVRTSEGRIGQYIFITFNIKGHGLNFELCMEPDHSWAFVSDEELVF